MGQVRSRARVALLSSALMMISLVMAFVLGELFLRMLGYAGAPESYIGNVNKVDDPILNWRFKPNSMVQDGEVIYKYNSRGFRDSEHNVEKRLFDVTRIVVLGDSVTEGAGVNGQEVFSAQLQKLLGDDHEVINLGMSGLNTPQEAHLLEIEGVRYKPDVVILNFVLNDCAFFTEFDAAEKFGQGKDAKIGILGDLSVDPRLKRFVKSSALIYFVKARVEHLIGLLKNKGEGGYYTKLWKSQQCQEHLTQGLNHLAELQRMNRFEVHVVVWPLLVDFKTYEYCWVHKQIRDEVLRRGFHFYDLFEVYQSFSYRRFQVTAEDNVHPNGVGHRLAAESYASWRQHKDDPGYGKGTVCSVP